MVLEEAKGVKETWQRSKVMPRMDCDGGFF
jgi:hypothetical protein